MKKREINANPPFMPRPSYEAGGAFVSGEARAALPPEGVLNPSNCHGGNIYAASRRTGIPLSQILDFSASINPLGVPKRAALSMKEHIKGLRHYPEPYSEGLSAHIGRQLGTGSETIICGNGSTELIYLIPRALRPAKVLIAAPTFGEYERACGSGGDPEVVSYRLRHEDAFDVDPELFIGIMSGRPGSNPASGSGTSKGRGPCRMAFLCNPNNPTGRLIAKKEVLSIADAALKLSCYLVVDEAFIDFCPGESVVAEVARNPYLIVLRSLTKFYALSGIRIGYGVFHPSVAEKIRACKEPWTVNSLAQAAGVAVLEDTAYQKASREMMEREKSFVEAEFQKIGIPFIPSAANYYLLKVEHGAAKMAAALEEKGILVRDCESFTGLDRTYIRVAVRSRLENERLLKEMADICVGS